MPDLNFGMPKTSITTFSLTILMDLDLLVLILSCLHYFKRGQLLISSSIGSINIHTFNSLSYMPSRHIMLLLQAIAVLSATTPLVQILYKHLAELRSVVPVFQSGFCGHKYTLQVGSISRLWKYLLCLPETWIPCMLVAMIMTKLVWQNVFQRWWRAKGKWCKNIKRVDIAQ